MAGNVKTLAQAGDLRRPGGLAHKTSTSFIAEASQEPGLRQTTY